jgi:hypothetical protein
MVAEARLGSYSRQQPIGIIDLGIWRQAMIDAIAISSADNHDPPNAGLVKRKGGLPRGWDRPPETWRARSGERGSGRPVM